MLLPFEFVFFVPYVINLIVVEEISDPCRQVAVDAVHVARRGHNGTHVFVTVLDTLLHLNRDIHTWLSNFLLPFQMYYSQTFYQPQQVWPQFESMFFPHK